MKNKKEFSEIRKKISEINNVLLKEKGLTWAEIDLYWKECIKEAKDKTNQKEH